MAWNHRENHPSTWHLGKTRRVPYLHKWAVGGLTDGTMVESLGMFKKYTPGSTNIAVAGKWTRIEDVFPIENVTFCCVLELLQDIFRSWRKTNSFLVYSDDSLHWFVSFVWRRGTTDYFCGFLRFGTLFACFGVTADISNILNTWTGLTSATFWTFRHYIFHGITFICIFGVLFSFGDVKSHYLVEVCIPGTRPRGTYRWAWALSDLCALKMGIFQPVMLVYQRVNTAHLRWKLEKKMEEIKIVDALPEN